MKNISDIATKIALVLVVLYIAYGYFTSSSKHRRTIIEMKQTSESVTFTLDDRNSYVLHLDATAYNRKNIKLLYKGKHVWVLKEKDNFWSVTPVKQDSMPMLTENEYYELVKEGFIDSDIEYSFKIPKGVTNKNKEKSTYGGYVSYGAPGLSVEKVNNKP